MIEKGNCVLLKFEFVPYEQSLKLQERLAGERRRGVVEDHLILLQHPDVFTIGRSGTRNNIKVTEKELDDANVKVFHVNRGGDITYHGPGQLVGYLIFDLRLCQNDIRLFLRRLQQTIIDTLADYSIPANLKEGFPGIWVGEEKIAALGLHIQDWVTTHGFALNVDPDMKFFEMIHPCGLKEKRATSMAKILHRKLDVGGVAENLVLHFANVFGVSMKAITEAPLAVLEDPMRGT